MTAMGLRSELSPIWLATSKTADFKELSWITAQNSCLANFLMLKALYLFIPSYS